MLMHEVMAAQNILTAILEETAKRTIRLVAAKISCGSLYAINDDALCFAFEAIAKGTPCEGVRLQIEHKPIRGRCNSCNQDFDVETSSPRCPKCGGEDFQLLPDAPLILEEIEFQPE
jgi:hydrogenase nickel incorporation protein HypA/HybF